MLALANSLNSIQLASLALATAALLFVALRTTSAARRRRNSRKAEVPGILEAAASDVKAITGREDRRKYAAAVKISRHSAVLNPQQQAFLAGVSASQLERTRQNER